MPTVQTLPKALPNKISLTMPPHVLSHILPELANYKPTSSLTIFFLKKQNYNKFRGLGKIYLLSKGLTVLINLINLFSLLRMILGHGSIAQLVALITPKGYQHPLIRSICP